jgi:hypothetical protein
MSTKLVTKTMPPSLSLIRPISAGKQMSASSRSTMLTMDLIARLKIEHKAWSKSVLISKRTRNKRISAQTLARISTKL